MADILKAVLQGLVQGITEWLPISSTAHLILVDRFLPFSFSQNFFDLFKVLIQLGSILAVVVLYFHNLNPFSAKKTAVQRTDTWSMWGKIVVASLPAAVVGLPLNAIVDDVLSRPAVIAATLLIYGVLFLWMESGKHTVRVHSVGEMTWKTALYIGCFQALSLIPGTSRSGATILGAVLLGCSRATAAEFSFYMAIPVMAGAGGLKAVKYFLIDGYTFSGAEWAALIVGLAMSFIVSVFVIRVLMNYIRRHDFKVFGWYRIALAVIIVLLLVTGAMSNAVIEA